jgi:hypothetical protein
VTGSVFSLPSLRLGVPGAAYTPMWLWVSMSPGVTNLPVPSTTVVPGGTVVSRPTATTLPFAKRMDAPVSSVPAAVRMVALRMSTGGWARRW